MMLTFCIIYTSYYLLLMLCFLILVCFHTPVKVFWNLSISNSLIFIQKYTIYNKIYLALLFCLTGLPPVGLFFVKFNIFLQIIYQLNFFYIIYVFFFFLFNMYFYFQIFKPKNTKSNVYSFVTSANIQQWNYGLFFYKNKQGYYRYKSILFIVTCLIFNLLAFFLLMDCILITSLV